MSKQDKKEIIAQLTAEKIAAQDALKAEISRKNALAVLTMPELAWEQVENLKATILPKTNVLKEKTAAVAVYLEKAKALKTNILALYDIEDVCKKQIYESKVLAEAGYFAEAKEAINTLEPITKIDLGIELSLCKLVREIIDWTNVDLDFQMREQAVETELTALELVEKVKALTTKFHFDEEKDARLDKGYLDAVCCAINEEEKAGVEFLKTSLALLSDYEANAPKNDPMLVYMAETLRSDCIEIYNALTANEEEMNGTYDTALALFGLKGAFEKHDLTSKLYRIAEDEREFRLSYLQAYCEKSTMEDYEAYLAEVVASLSQKNEDSVSVVANLFANEKLSAEKQAKLFEAYKTLSANQQIAVLAETLHIHPASANISALVEILTSAKKRLVDLEENACYLLTIKEALEGETSKKYNEFLASLLRSPKAHKIKRKSTSAEVHALFNDKFPFEEPVGCKMNSSAVAPMGKGKAFLYWALVIVLPILLACAGGYFTYYFFYGQPLFTFVAIAPLAFLYIFGIIHTYQWAGRDERYSAAIKRTYLVSGLWKAVLALVYFIIPGTLAFLAPLAYTLVILAALELAIAVFFFKDFHKRWNFILALPLFLVEIANVVFIVLHLMGAM